MKLMRGWIGTAASMVQGETAYLLETPDGGLEVRSTDKNYLSQRTEWSGSGPASGDRGAALDKARLAAAINLCTGETIDLTFQWDSKDAVTLIFKGKSGGSARFPVRVTDIAPVTLPEGAQWGAVPGVFDRKLPDALRLGTDLEWGGKSYKAPVLGIHEGGILCASGAAAWWRDGDSIGTFRFPLPPSPERWRGDDVEMCVAGTDLFVRGNGFAERYRGYEGGDVEAQARGVAQLRALATDGRPTIEIGRAYLLDQIDAVTAAGSWPPSAAPVLGLRFDPKKRKGELSTWKSALEGKTEISASGTQKIELVCFNPSILRTAVAAIAPKSETTDPITLAFVPMGGQPIGVIIVQGPTGDGAAVAVMRYSEEDRTLEVIVEKAKRKSGQNDGKNKESEE